MLSKKSESKSRKKFFKKKVNHAKNRRNDVESYFGNSKSVAHRVIFERLPDHSLLDFKDEKNAEVVRLTRTMASNLLGSKPFIIATGTRTDLSFNGASVARFGLPTGPVLAFSLSPTVCPEFTALSTLFDEFKVSGIKVRYNPINPYNRGAVTQSVPLGLFLDDVDNALVPTNTNLGMGAAAQRGNSYYSFSADHSFERVFMRHQALTFYDWTPVLSPGTEPSTFGGLYIVGDGTGTASTIMGFMEYWFLVEFRMRQ